MTELTLKSAQSAFSWGRGGYFEEVEARTYEFAKQALAQFPNDEVVLYRSLQVWAPFATPQVDSPSAGAPSSAEGLKHLKVAMTAAERVLKKMKKRERLEQRALFFWVTMLRVWPQLLQQPSKAELEHIERELHAAYDELATFEGVVQSHQHVSGWLRTLAATRWRAWQYLAGALTFESLKEKLTNYLSSSDTCLGWPIEPLIHDQAFSSRIADELRNRSASGSHPKRPYENHKPSIMKVLKPFHDQALVGRVEFLAWLGLDQEFFFDLAAQTIEHRLPPAALEVLLNLGFDVNAIPRLSSTGSGYTLLHEATVADNAGAVKVLLAHKANPKKLSKPDSRGKKFKRQSALDLAKSRKRPAVIAAFGGTQSAPSKKAEALGTALRAAAKSMKAKQLVWAGSLYGVQTPQPMKVIEAVLEGAPESPEQVLENAAQRFVFDRYIVACALRDAGHRVDRTIKGSLVLKDELITLSGDLVVSGLLVDANPTGSVVVAGDVKVGALVTEADFLVGGSLTATDFILGSGTEGALMVEHGTVQANVLAMRGHTFEHEGKQHIETLLDEDADDSELARHFTEACFKAGSLDVLAVRAEATKGRALLGQKPKKPKKSK